jgi:hypothetical protein
VLIELVGSSVEQGSRQQASSDIEPFLVARLWLHCIAFWSGC